MDDATPSLFENPPQPETPEALLQRRKHKLLLDAMAATDKEERKQLLNEYTGLIAEQHSLTPRGNRP